MSVVPTFVYHPTEAPMGRKFTDQVEVDALGPDWVDTPAKFPVPNDQEKTGEIQEIPVRRGPGRPRKETV